MASKNLKGDLIWVGTEPKEKFVMQEHHQHIKRASAEAGTAG
jgi:hypothetical protein